MHDVYVNIRHVTLGMTEDQGRNRVVLPDLDTACSALASLVSSGGGAPTLHQYWDRDPPRQVRRLMTHNARLCRRWGAPYRCWTASDARDLLAAHYPDILPVFDAVPHPAMGSDLFRLCVLHRQGGVYLDADMALRRNGGRRLFSGLAEGLLFKWSREDRHNLPNWCMAFRAGHPALAHLIAATADSLSRALAHDPDAGLRNILTVSGPGLFTRAVADWVARHGPPPGLVILDVREAYRMVQNGPDLLNAPLAYKRTARHWLVAAREGLSARS